MKATDRREAIIESVIPVFAEYGLHGASTRRLAEAAGVSEALIYRHFPSKAALFHAITLQHLQRTAPDPALERLRAMPSGPRRLVLAVRHLVQQLVAGDALWARMVATSFATDGAAARQDAAAFQAEYLSIIRLSLQAARRKKSAKGGSGNRLVVDAWLVQHLALACRLMTLPASPVVDYGMRDSQRIEAIVQFALLGLGLRRSEIKRHNTPAAYKSLLADQ